MRIYIHDNVVRGGRGVLGVIANRYELQLFDAKWSQWEIHLAKVRIFEYGYIMETMQCKMTTIQGNIRHTLTPMRNGTREL